MKRGADAVDQDTLIRDEVARIKAAHPFQGDYRGQLAALIEALFFKFGERAGAARLVALLAENGRSPSTGTAQDELNRFWERLRRSTGKRLDNPAVPAPLLELFGQLAGSTWETALEQAQAALAGERQAVADLRQQAETALQKAHDEVRQAQHEQELFRQQAEQALAERDDARRLLAAERARREALDVQLQDTVGQLSEHVRVREQQAAQFEETMANMRTALEQSASEQRRLLVVADDYKQQASRDRAARTKAETQLEAAAVESRALQAKVEDLSRLAGELQGQLQTYARLGEAAGTNSAAPRRLVRQKVRRR